MKVNLFTVSTHIGKVDLKKIKLKSKFGRAWLSKTPSSFKNKNSLDEESEKYLVTYISELLKGHYYNTFELGIADIWQNQYKNKDYQEPHVHAFTKFSFIIYKKIVEPRTIFFNPAKNVISMLGADDIFPTSYMPKLKSGSIIIFPSFIEHMVVPNSDQITISGNLVFNKIEDKNATK